MGKREVSPDDVALAISHVGQAMRLLSLSPEVLSVPELDLGNTPERVVRMWIELTEGLREDPPEVTAFDCTHDQMFVLRDLCFTSLCSHHLAPFWGKVHIGYIPNGRVVGISKPARVVDYFATRPQTQELLTQQIADFLTSMLRPQGVIVVISAEHACVSCRGVRKPGSRFVTSAITGVFLTDPGVKQEFLSLLGVNHIA
jgi:GTP cyclohydrolase I